MIVRYYNGLEGLVISPSFTIIRYYLEKFTFHNHEDNELTINIEKTSHEILMGTYGHRFYTIEPNLYKFPSS